MILEKIIQGEHRGRKFKWDNGFLHTFDRRWDKQEIEILIEIANLLQIEGYKIKKPKRMEKKQLKGCSAIMS